MPASAREVLGRAAERAALREALDRALGGSGHVVVLAGEAGAGKTTLAEDLAATAAAKGAVVAWGRCWEAGGAPELWPWRTVIAQLAAEPDIVEATGRLGEPVAALAAVVPELAGALPAGAAASAPQRSSFGLVEAGVALLRAAAAVRPIVVVLEDLHAADAPSARGLALAGGAVHDLPVLLVATLREGATAERPEIEGVVREIGRQALRVDVGGLDREALAALLAAHAGGPVPTVVVRAIAARTGGNPFFATELARLLGPRLLTSSAVADAPLPDGLEEAVRPRLAGLPGDVRDVLETAALVGQEFGQATLARATGLARPALLELLDEAEAQGIAEPVPGRPGAHRFTHALLREGLVAGLRTSARARRHGRIADALEAQAGAEPGDVEVYEIAHHRARAAAAEEPAGAAQWCERAARRAAAAGAHEQAAAHWAAGLGALELLDAPEPDREIAFLLEAGRAEQVAGLPEGREHLLAAAAAARARGDRTRLVDAALAFGPFGLTPGVVDADWVRLLDDALAACGPDDRADALRLRARLTRALYYHRGDRPRPQPAQVAEEARALGDPAVLRDVLADLQLALWTPATLEDGLAASAELRALPGQDPEDPALIPVLLREAEQRLSLGDVAGAAAADAHAAELAERHRDVRGLAVARLHQARWAILEGRFADVGPLQEEALGIAAWLPASPIPTMVAGQQLSLRRRVGGLAELEPAVRRAAEALPGMPIWRVATALVLVETGRPREARDIVDRLAADGLREVPFDDAWLSVAGLCGEVAARTGSPLAPALRELLEPYAGRLMGTVGATYLGQLDRVLGMLAAAAGDQDAAAAHLARAQEQAAQAGAVPDRLLAAAEELVMLSRAGEDVAARAAELREDAARLGLGGLAERLAGLEGDGGAPRAAAAPAGGPATGELRREGDVWSLRLDGRQVTVKDAKGVRHLAVLLAQPGVEVAALDLETARGGSRRAGAAAAQELGGTGEGDLGELLDAGARRAYRERAEELREELELAERHNDPERAAALRAELEMLVDELAGATGLGGRARRTGSPAERARVNVTRAVKGVLRRIEGHDAALAAELTSTVRTGTFCVYQPDPRRPVRWEVRT